jgi:hypothetical protein
MTTNNTINQCDIDKEPIFISRFAIVFCYSLKVDFLVKVIPRPTRPGFEVVATVLAQNARPILIQETELI